MLKKTLILFFILTFILCSEAFSEENQIDEGIFSRIFRGLSISPGITFKVPMILIKRRSDGHQAEMMDSPGVLSFVIDVSTRDYDFANTNFGWSLFLHSSSFKASTQIAGVNGGKIKEHDFGTSVSGRYSYLIPALYYKLPKAEGEMKLGVGLGYGSARLNGSALFGPERMVSSSTPKSSLSTSANDVIAYMFFLDFNPPSAYHFRLSYGGPVFRDSEYQYIFEEFTFTVSYTFSIM